MLRSVWVRGVLFAVVLLIAAQYGRPWDFGWMRPDEVDEIAENFLFHQNADLGKYTQIRATEYRKHGEWNRMESGPVDVGDPAVGYVLRYFAPGTMDGWTMGISPAGRIYRVTREQFEDQPGAELNSGTALALAEVKMAADLGLPIERLTLYSDTLFVRSQRNDWGFVFAVNDPLPQPCLRVELSGDALTGLSTLDAPRQFQQGKLPERTESNRLLGFAIMLVGVFIIWQFHKAPLAAEATGTWGGVTFVLILLSRGLLFPQSVLGIPADVPYAGYLSRIALSAIVDALQAALIMGLAIATGDSALRDHLRRSTTLTRLGKGIRNWPYAWTNAARWALTAAAGMVLIEIIAMKYLGPVGLSSKLPPIIAGTLSSPLPALALPVQLATDVIWDEGLYRLWLFPFTLLFFRPWLGVLVAAGLVTYWAGFNPTQITQPGCMAYLLWNTVAGVLVAGSGILAAVLFHLFALAGLAAVTVFWIGFHEAAAGVVCGLLAGVIALIGWQELKELRRAGSPV